MSATAAVHEGHLLGTPYRRVVLLAVTAGLTMLLRRTPPLVPGQR